MSEISRRELFSFWRKKPAAKDPSDEPDEPDAPAAPPDPLRPPGAVFDELLVEKCSHCGECVKVCPADAIFLLDDSFGRSAGTPAIVARQAPCLVCTGLQCTQVCPTHVLTRVAVFDVQMGTAVVEETTCLTWRGEACGVCVSACPVPGALAAVDGHPLVEPTRCIGCGVCEKMCPTPAASIVVLPARPIAR